MTLAKNTFTVFITLVCAAVAHAESPAIPHSSPEIQFSIAGVGIGTTLDEFHKLIPTAIAGQSPTAGPTQNAHLVVLNNGASQVPTAYFRFLDDAVSVIDIHYTQRGMLEIEAKQPMIDQLVDRFGEYTSTRHSPQLNGGITSYTWLSDKHFLLFTRRKNGKAELFFSSNPVPEIYPPKTPRTSLLGIDPATH